MAENKTEITDKSIKTVSRQKNYTYHFHFILFTKLEGETENNYLKTNYFIYYQFIVNYKFNQAFTVLPMGARFTCGQAVKSHRV